MVSSTGCAVSRTPLTFKKKRIVDVDEYQQARAELLKQEKEATQLLQKLAASRRELPMVEISDPARFKFDAPGGEKSLVDLFDGLEQLIIYHFMLGPGEQKGCVGCSFCMDHIPDLGHLRSRNTSFVAVATAPLSEITSYQKRMGWKFPFYSSAKTHQTWKEIEENGETVPWKPGNGYFGLCVFRKDGDRVFHTYDTTDRGLEIVLSTYHLLDMTPMGRQEVGNGMNEFSLHDEY
ncbi:hypothetical protein N7451_005159 [Penicillium sp. IBT 35674x]|nr:hypothetical protein N7451_005159 [Penicillium sp. IBT 35674x]